MKTRGHRNNNGTADGDNHGDDSYHQLTRDNGVGGGGGFGGDCSTSTTTKNIDKSKEEESPHHSLRLNVFRELLLVRWYPRRPRIYEARPKHFPSSLNVFVTGGLYARLQHDAVANLLPWYHKVHMITMFVLLLAYLIYFWDSPVLFETNDDTGITTMKLGIYWLDVCILYMISNIISYMITRPAVRAFHRQAESVVQELSPLFTRAGYKVTYCPSYWHDDNGGNKNEPRTWCGGVRSALAQGCCRCVGPVFDNESYVRFVRIDANEAVIMSDDGDGVEADAGWGPSINVTNNDGFRVAVWGRQAYPGWGTTGLDPNFNFFSFQSLTDVQSRIDLFTWGAVATSFFESTARYQWVRFGIIITGVVISQLAMWFPDTFYDSLWPTLVWIGIMVVFLVLMLHPTALEMWWLVHVMRTNVLDDMRAIVQTLSPLVEERSGYSLHLETEPDGCLGGTTAYVRFDPSSPAAATSSTSLIQGDRRGLRMPDQ